MSRRPDKAAQNQQVIKNLLKLEANKNCADCKRNKHPRWASWNLGVFVCIRCSGIHRGMGTHISRVKSVDLDAWTDEQLQSIMKWGNARANRYWEFKLAVGHVPSDAKIENFIRTKYESKRWVMDGPIPDPSTLGNDGDEDVPLTTVQERARLDRSSSQRASSASNQSSQIQRAQKVPPAPPAASFNLIDGDDLAPVPQRASTTEPHGVSRPPPPRAAAAQTSQLLGGLDFLGGPPERPAGTSSGTAAMTRPDLKQSILSLYASKPSTQSASQPILQAKDMTTSNLPNTGTNNNFTALNDAFGSLSFSPTATSSSPQSMTQLPAQVPTFAAAPKAQPAKPDAYAALSGFLTSSRSSLVSPQVTSPPALAGGSFFESSTKPHAKPQTQPTKTNIAPPLLAQASTDDWGDFSIAGDAKPTSSPQPTAPTKSSTLLDFTSGAAADFSPPPAASAVVPDSRSAFHLPSSKPAQTASTTKTSHLSPSFPSDPWSSNEWATPDPAPQANSITAIAASKASNDFGWSAPSDWGTSATAPSTTLKSSLVDAPGWGDTDVKVPAGLTEGLSSMSPTAPKVQPEEDFGGWGVAEQAPARPAIVKQPSQPQTGSSTVGGNSEDLFANVWG